MAAIGLDSPALETLSAVTGIECVSHPDLESLLAKLEDERTAVPDAVLLDLAGLREARLSSHEEAIEGGPDAEMVERVERFLASLLELAQRWVASVRVADVPLFVVTREAVTERSTGESPDMLGACAWGMVRSAQVEHPGRFVLIDVDDRRESWEAVTGLLALDETQAVVRAGSIRVARLAPIEGGRSITAVDGGDGSDHLDGSPAPGGRRGQGSFVGEGTVLLTGATGALGRVLARHLVERLGVRDLLLVSRSGAAAGGSEELAEQLGKLGASVELRACDVSDRGEVEQLLASIPAERQLRGVVHAAGVLDDGVLSSLTAERLPAVLGAKLAGAWHLHELTAELDLDAFVLFSSLSASLGSAGQANYAAANAFLDGLAAHRRVLGLPAVSIGWGPWRVAGGMSGGLDAGDMARLAEAGVRPIEPARGMELFDRAIGADAELVLAADFDREVLRERARSHRLDPLMRELVPASERGGAAVGGRIASAAIPERPRVAIELVLSHTASVLGHSSPAAIEPEQAFKEMGLDSLGAVELRNRLGREMGGSLPTTLVFDFPTPLAVAGFLVGRV
ncbi:MAG TPA: beta-ketoacyl reductase, partial [Solirubrobacteraceae bacterium]|nr:beta-ketoacyl reductase [Solirubrobacteraceae bacterium]